MATSSPSITSSFFGWAAATANAAASNADTSRIGLAAIHHPPLRRISESELDDGIEQPVVVASRRGRSAGEVLILRQMRIGIGLQRVDAAIGLHAKIHAGVAGETERAIHAARQPVE